jgi:hypothetical protein
MRIEFYESLDRRMVLGTTTETRQVLINLYVKVMVSPAPAANKSTAKTHLDDGGQRVSALHRQ